MTISARFLAVLTSLWFVSISLSAAGSRAADNEEGIAISNSSPRQGETLRISVPRALADASGDATVGFAGEKIPLYPAADGSDTLSTLIAVPADLDPGTQPLTICGVEHQLKVIDARFPTQTLRLPPKKNNFNASPGEKEAIKAAKEEVIQERFWQGKFKYPVKTVKFSSRFGLGRVVNGKRLKDYYHSGLDFRGATGTPVLACADGKVSVAATGWKLHGNTVCIDHGQGVVTIYIHMNSVKVKSGDLVKAGQQIGTIGSTGRASGPHLHLSLYVNKIAANPEPWFQQVF